MPATTDGRPCVAEHTMAASIVAVDENSIPTKVQESSDSWADEDNTGEWTLCQPQKKRNKPRVQGASDNHRIKAVPRKNILAAFFSPMDKNTQPDDLVQHLAGVGIPDVVAEK